MSSVESPTYSIFPSPASGSAALMREYGDGFPRLLRIKAIQGLAKFEDPGVLDYIIPILENPNNYEYYFDILNLAQELNAKENYMNLIRKSAHMAMLNSLGNNN